MSDVFSRLRVMDVLLENERQKILKCKDRENEDVYFVNAIVEKEGLDVEEFERINSYMNIFNEIKETADTCYLISKDRYGRNIKDYMNTEDIPLSSRIKYIEYVLDNLTILSGTSNYITASLANFENVFIDKNKNPYFSNKITLVENYDKMGKDKVFKNIADFMSIVFSGDGLTDIEIEGNLPPDIKKIILNCNESYYKSYQELRDDFKKTKTYKMIYPSVDSNQNEFLREEIQNTPNRNQELEQRRPKAKKVKKKRKIKISKRTIAIIAAIILLPILIDMGRTYLNKKNNDETAKTDKKIIQIDDSDGSNAESTTNDDQKEEIKDYYNGDMLNPKDGELVGEIDTSNSYKGTSSIKVSNPDATAKEFVVGVLDLNDEKFKKLKDQDTNFSFWLNAADNLDATVTVKLYSGDEFVREAKKDVMIIKDKWVMDIVNINLDSGDSLKVFLTLKDKGDAWIDAFELKILK